MTRGNGIFVNDLMHESINPDRATTFAYVRACLKDIIFFKIELFENLD